MENQNQTTKPKPRKPKTNRTIVPVFLASDGAAAVNGQIFLCAGPSYALVSYPRPVATIYKESRWTVDELIATVPDTLMLGVANPAPPRASDGKGA